MTIHHAAKQGYQIASDTYERGRPDYPREAVDFMMERLSVNKDTVVLDLGAGTGKWTQYLLPTQAKIIALEPVEKMREKLILKYPAIQIIDGTAENIPLPDSSIDAVCVAQAFHWFSGEAALREIYRILKPEGSVGLIWNSRDDSIEWVSELTQLIDPHEKGAPRYKYGLWKGAWKKSKQFSPLEEKNFRYNQVGPREMIVDRVASISFIAALQSNKLKEVLDSVCTLLDRHPQTKDKRELTLPYRTDVFISKKLKKSDEPDEA